MNCEAGVGSMGCNKLEKRRGGAAGNRESWMDLEHGETRKAGTWSEIRREPL